MKTEPEIEYSEPNREQNISERISNYIFIFDNNHLVDEQHCKPFNYYHLCAMDVGEDMNSFILKWIVNQTDFNYMKKILKECNVKQEHRNRLRFCYEEYNVELRAYPPRKMQNGE